MRAILSDLRLIYLVLSHLIHTVNDTFGPTFVQTVTLKTLFLMNYHQNISFSFLSVLIGFLYRKKQSYGCKIFQSNTSQE